ncbi:MAG TPA: hypothetical protein VG105_04065 [Paraburkholderia sp.]|jgi:hypothetical protein|nr:hypothetical protein [Paraburkholderia sp.]
MKTWNKTSRSMLAALVAGGALLTAGSAFAQADRMVISAPGPVTTYEQPRMMPVGVQIDLGWHGDRYWDGHRYWAHDDWMRHHPHDPDPRHHDHGAPPRHDN